ncbi:hypothetical protein B0H13DRAFT_1021594 [Mycena leptocephala]|nr:hypothetical protein B0H13DRAFT_1021594 [Mycena leptocephala]
MGAVQSHRLPLIHAYPCTLLWLAGQRHPASFRRPDAQTTLSSVCSARFPFWVLRAFGVRAEAAFLGPLPSSSPVGVRVPWNEHMSPCSSCARGSAVGSVHASEAAAAASSPHVCISRILRAGRRRWMEKEERADGDRMTIQMSGCAWMETKCAYISSAPSPYRDGCVCVYGTCLTLVLTFARVIERSRRGVRRHSCRRRHVLPTRIRWAHALRI